MAHYKFDLVQETSTSTGAVTMALAGAVTRRRRFGDVLANADTCYVFIEHASAAEWQICLATWNTGHSLTLGAVLASSTGVAVTFSAGTKTISIVAPAAKSVVENNNGDAAITRNATVAGTLGVTGASNLGLTGVGGASTAADRAFVVGMGALTGTTIYGTVSSSNIPATVTAAATIYYSGPSTAASAFTLSLLRHYSASSPATFGAGSTVTTQYGFIAESTLTGATNNIGFYGNIAAAASRWNFHAAGTAQNYFAGNVGIGSGKMAPAVALDVAGAITASSTITSSNLFMQGDGSHGYFRTTTGNLYLGTGGVNSWLINATGNHLLPGTDNTYNLGSASFRVKEVFAGLATINTSGRAAKLSISEATVAEKRAAATIKANPRRYKMADAVAEKGDAARWHFGYIAEDVRDALAAEGLDPWAYAFLCSDPLIKRETYFETATRAKMRKVTTTESAVEIIDGKPVMVAKQVARDEPVGVMVAVVDEAGQPVMQQTGADETTGEPIMSPMMHLVPEMEEYEVEKTREVDSGEVRLGLRYSELEAFLRSAD